MKLKIINKSKAKVLAGALLINSSAGMPLSDFKVSDLVGAEPAEQSFEIDAKRWTKLKGKSDAARYRDALLGMGARKAEANWLTERFKEREAGLREALLALAEASEKLGVPMRDFQGGFLSFYYMLTYHAGTFYTCRLKPMDKEQRNKAFEQFYDALLKAIEFRNKNPRVKQATVQYIRVNGDELLIRLE